MGVLLCMKVGKSVYIYIYIYIYIYMYACALSQTKDSLWEVGKETPAAGEEAESRE